MYSVAFTAQRSRLMDSLKQGAYISVLMDLLPLFALAFSIFFLKGLKGLRYSMVNKSFIARFVNVIISSALGGVFAVGCALMLPLLDKGSDPMVMVGVVVFVAVAGVKIVDGLLYKKLGVHFIDGSDPDSADSVWVSMNDKEKEDCIKQWQEHAAEDKDGDK